MATATSGALTETLEIPVAGMDCTECTQHVQKALQALPGVHSANVFLSSEKAIIQLDPSQVDMLAIRGAVAGAGYSVPEHAEIEAAGAAPATAPGAQAFTRQILGLLGVLFCVVLFAVVVGEGFGLFDRLTERVPWPVGAALVAAAGYPVFRKVVLAALRRQVISHTLMSVGVIAALVVGQWATALLVVFFMRVGDYAESLTTERARRAVKDLSAMSPQTARVERDGAELDEPINQVMVGDTVVVRPGEKIPVDGEVIAGQATVNQATITGESMPVEVGVGAGVFAATIAQLGSIRVRATRVGTATTFGRVVRMVEEAEAHRADVQRFADKVSGYYLPVVAGIALLTFLIKRDPLSTAAVLVVACSCSFALATPIAMLASIGAAARRGLLVKGGKYLESLARADVVLLDKTGTLTLGQPKITDIVTLNGLAEADVLSLAASAEQYSEHPLAEAVRSAARSRNLTMTKSEGFRAIPGMGVEARIGGNLVLVGNSKLVQGVEDRPAARQLLAQGKTLLYMAYNGQPAALLAASDTLRPEVPAAIAALRQLGVKHIELLTGDNEQTASSMAEALGISYRAELLPEDKIAIVKEYQAKGHTVVMVGDGVNDAPALAQANVGVAMGVPGKGTDIAMEAGHVVLLRDDWTLVPDLFRIAQRTMRVVKGNIGFTIVYNIVGLTLAAFGFLPPIFAAAAQSIPDLGITANSARLLKQK